MTSKEEQEDSDNGIKHGGWISFLLARCKEEGARMGLCIHHRDGNLDMEAHGTEGETDV
jgi:hypothetical protein